MGFTLPLMKCQMILQLTLLILCSFDQSKLATKGLSITMTNHICQRYLAEYSRSSQLCLLMNSKTYPQSITRYLRGLLRGGLLALETPTKISTASVGPQLVGWH